MLEALLSMLKTPPQPNTGEAYILHQSLSAFYFLRVKAHIYEAHSGDEELKVWWRKAHGAFEKYIEQHEALMKELGIPLPAKLPESPDLTDQFIATDSAAMVKGMLEAHTRGLHMARRSDVALLYRQMLDGALMAGAQLVPIVEREGWISMPPTYGGG